MTLKLTLFSQEKDDFVREILIASDAKFSELHQLILNDCNYKEHNMQSFLICDEDWRVRQRVCLQESEEVSYDMDINLMDETRIGDFLEDEGQRLAYVFDPDDKRFFLMELTENVFGRKEGYREPASWSAAFAKPHPKLSGGWLVGRTLSIRGGRRRHRRDILWRRRLRGRGTRHGRL